SLGTGGARRSCSGVIIQRRKSPLGIETERAMAFRDTWHRALVYFGLAEDPDYVDEEGYEPETGQGDIYESPAPRTATVSRIGERRRMRDEIDDIFADEEPAGRTRSLRPVGN